MNQDSVVEAIEQAITAMREYEKQPEESTLPQGQTGKTAIKNAVSEFFLIASRVLPPPVGTSAGTPIICPRCNNTINVILS